jgi:hypothetical protein
LLENGAKCRARVFNIEVDAAGQDRLMTDVGSGQIETPVHRQMRPGFEVLREQFSQDRLLSEVLGPDYDSVLANPSAARQKSATERNEQSSGHVVSGLARNQPVILSCNQRVILSEAKDLCSS